MKTLIIKDLKANHKPQILIDLDEWLPLLNNIKEYNFKIINDFEIESSTGFSENYSMLLKKIKNSISECYCYNLNFAEIELLANENSRQTIWMELKAEKDDSFVELECFDCSYWIVRTNLQAFVNQVYLKFTNVIEE